MGAFLTVKDVAKFFGRNPQTIYKWIKRGWIKPIVLRIGANNYYQFQIDCLAALYGGQIGRLEIEKWLSELMEGARKNICKWEKDS